MVEVASIPDSTAETTRVNPEGLRLPDRLHRAWQRLREELGWFSSVDEFLAELGSAHGVKIYTNQEKGETGIALSGRTDQADGSKEWERQIPVTYLVKILQKPGKEVYDKRYGYDETKQSYRVYLGIPRWPVSWDVADSHWRVVNELISKHKTRLFIQEVRERPQEQRDLDGGMD